MGGGGAKPQIMSKSTLNYPETCTKVGLITLRCLKVKVNEGEGGGVVLGHPVLSST